MNLMTANALRKIVRQYKCMAGYAYDIRFDLDDYTKDPSDKGGFRKVVYIVFRKGDHNICIDYRFTHTSDDKKNEGHVIINVTGFNLELANFHAEEVIETSVKVFSMDKLSTALEMIVSLDSNK